MFKKKNPCENVLFFLKTEIKISNKRNAFFQEMLLV